MELADLVRAVIEARETRRARLVATAKILARFALIGVAIFGVKRLVEGAPREVRPLVVEVDAGTDDAGVRRRIDDAILLDLALRAGWARSDAVVRERMQKSLGVVEDVSDPDATIERGLRMQLPARDPVARARLVSVARESVARSEPERTPTDEEIAAYVEAHAEAYRIPGRARFDTVFLSAARRGDRLDEDASAVRRSLVSAPDAPVSSDACPVSFHGSVDEERLDAIVGPGFGASVMQAPDDVWSGPIVSPFGVYFVRVREREPSRLASVDEARASVTARLREDARAAAFERRMVSLRDAYDVSVERRP